MLGPLERKITSTSRDVEKFHGISHWSWAWGLKEKSLSVQKGERAFQTCLAEGTWWARVWRQSDAGGLGEGLVSWFVLSAGFEGREATDGELGTPPTGFGTALWVHAALTWGPKRDFHPSAVKWEEKWGWLVQFSERYIYSTQKTNLYLEINHS